MLVIQPDASDSLQRFEGWFLENGIALTTVRPFEGNPVPAKLEADGLVVLGGVMSAHDDGDHVWLKDVRTLIRSTVEGGQPLLGICLGAQLLARSMGGYVVETSQQGVEAGVVRIRLREAASEDPLLADLPQQTPMGSMHSDMIAQLPPDATWLADSDLYPHQAFRVGECAWGLQFHPEVEPAVYERWAKAYYSEDPHNRRCVERGVDELWAMDSVVIRGAEVIARKFAAVVTRRADKTFRERAVREV